MRLEHANITVRDVSRSLPFYCTILGFDVRWEGTANGENGPVRAVHLGTADTYVSLFETGREAKAPADYARAGLNHIGFEVDDLAPYRARLAEAGVSVHLEQNYEPGERIYFYDPDGTEIELVAYGVGEV